jgi:hypothetical protein
MTGVWLTSLARRILRDETFERLVSPAIADLQCEAAEGPAIRLRHYAALASVLACAMLRDFRLGLGTAFDADTRRRLCAWPAVWCLGFAAALIGWSEFRESLLVLGPVARSAALTTALTGSLVGVFTTFMTIAAFFLVRRGAPAGAVAAATLAVFIAALVTAFALHPIRLSADRELYALGQSLSTGATTPDSLLATWLAFKADDVNSTLGRWRDIRGALEVINGALFGAILARRRGWMVPLTLVSVPATTFLVGMIVIRIESTVLRGVPSYAFQDWRSVAVSFLVASAWLLMTRSAHGSHERSRA